MKKKLLVAYGTRCGSTGEIAKAIGEVLCASGFEVDVLPAKEVKSADGYSGIVLGSAVRMGQLMSEVKRLAKRQSRQIATAPVAYFAVCLTMKDDTPKNRETAAGYLKPLVSLKAPVSTGLFAGAMDLAKLNGFFRWMASKDKSGAFKTEDCRNWGAIRTWAGELADKFA
jgi:menaquinone-dependent protoporphyrinogen oxidase